MRVLPAVVCLVWSSAAAAECPKPADFQGVFRSGRVDEVKLTAKSSAEVIGEFKLNFYGDASTGYISMEWEKGAGECRTIKAKYLIKVEKPGATPTERFVGDAGIQIVNDKVTVTFKLPNGRSFAWIGFR